MLRYEQAPHKRVVAANQPLGSSDVPQLSGEPQQQTHHGGGHLRQTKGRVRMCAFEQARLQGQQ